MTRRRNKTANSGTRVNNTNKMTTSKSAKSPSGNASLQNNPSNYRTVYNKTDRLSGSDYFGPVTVKSTTSTASDKILAVVPISPSSYPGTRITQLSNLYERFSFVKFSLRYVSAVPNTLACQFVLYIDTDPNDDPFTISDPDSLIRQAVSQTGSQQWNFNSSKTTPLAIRPDGQLYYTGTDKSNERFNRQGTAYLIQITDPINFNGGTLTGDLQAGSLFIDWVVDFSTPQINPESLISFVPVVLPVLNSTSSLTPILVSTGVQPLGLFTLSFSLEFDEPVAADRALAFSAASSDSFTTTTDATQGPYPIGVTADANGDVFVQFSFGNAPVDFPELTKLTLYLYAGQ